MLLPQFQAADVAQQLEERVREHAAWIETNGSAQLRAYTDFVAARQGSRESKGGAAPLATAPPGEVGGQPAAGSNGAAAESAAARPEVQLDAFKGRTPQSLAVLADFDTQAVVDDLESRVRDVVSTHLPCSSPLMWAAASLHAVVGDRSVHCA